MRAIAGPLRVTDTCDSQLQVQRLMPDRKSAILNWLLRSAITGALVLMVAFAPELALLLDAALVDLFVIVFSSAALAHFSALRSALAMANSVLQHARTRLERSLLARPSAFCLTAGFTCMCLLLPGSRSAMFGLLLPALIPDWRLG